MDDGPPVDGTGKQWPLKALLDLSQSQSAISLEVMLAI
jgi:hypothetical protein